MSLTKKNMENVDSENQKRILKSWYKILDEEFGEHGDPDDGCDICYEAIQLGIIGDREPEYPENEVDPMEYGIGDIK